MNILRNFIVFEGIDGSGTTTQLTLLKERLAHKKVWFTAEPTALETGVFLRRVLRGEISLEPHTVARLFAADRNEHLYGKDGIISHLNCGGLVINDRYIFSNLAYQSLECSSTLLAELNAVFALPEYVFFFDIDPALSLNRISERNVTEIYEKQDILQKVRTSYLEIFASYQKTAEKYGMHIIFIDATESIEKIHQKIWTILENMPILTL